jgi:CrcB protein
MSLINTTAPLVALGGAVGATLRYATALVIEPLCSANSLSVSTVAVNVLGCFCAGGLLAIYGGSLEAVPQSARALLFTGVLGGFTTFSAFGIDVLVLVLNGQVMSACISIALNVFGSLAGVLGGYKIALLIFGTGAEA